MQKEKQRKHGNFLFLSVNKNKIIDVEENFTMNKKLVATITTALVIGAFGTTFAAPADSFSDVPKDHWAYQAVQELAKDGVIQGYSDNEFKGDRPLTRYEFSMVVAKAIDNFETANDSDKAKIDKLSAEFAGELNRIGKRVAVVEKKTNTWIGGETRVRIMDNSPKQAGATPLKGSNKMDFRQRITIKGDIDKDTSFAGRLTASGKMGADTGASGSTVYLDLANITVKDAFGFDRVRVGRSQLDSIGHGLIGKPQNVDGLLFEKKFGDTNFKAYTGNPEPSESNGNSQQITTAEFTHKLNDKVNVSAGYFWSDAVATANSTGTGDLNIYSATTKNIYTSSKGTSLAFDWKIGKYTLMADYLMTNLEGLQDNRLSSTPKGWAIQFGTIVGQKTYYNSTMLVDKTQKGADGWMVSYRSLDAGAVPNAVGGFTTMGVADKSDPYSVYTHATDNVNVLFLAYQKVLRRNVVMSLEYQDFKIKDRSLTNLSSKDLDKTYQAKFQFWY